MIPRAYLTPPRELSPAMRRLFVARHWIDGRTVQRLERPDPEHVALIERIGAFTYVNPYAEAAARYRLHQIEPAPEPRVDVTG